MGERVRNIKTGHTQDAAGAHLSPEEIGKFSNGELTAEENRRAQKHLASCEQCRRDLVVLVRLAAAEVTEAERHMLQSLPAFESNEVVRQIAAQIPAFEEEDLQTTELKPGWWERLKTLIPQPVLAPAFATALVAFVALGSFGGYRLYVRAQINNDLDRGYEALQQRWKVSANDFRPAGQFERSQFSRPHGPAASPAADPAVNAFENVLRRDDDNRAARLGLALFYSFSGRMAQADSLLQKLLQRDSTDTEAWNQRGLVRARTEQYEAALAAFAVALRHQPEYNEAAFNRALLLTRMQRRAEAIAAWQDYLRRDANSSWSAAARAHLRKLERP